MTQKCDDINKFWHKFQKEVVDSGVSEAMAIWHIKWAKKFAVSLRGKPLRSCSAGDVNRLALERQRKSKSESKLLGRQISDNVNI
ncbi:MAG: hypothetical protein H8D67_20485 [Deltaproteobacteria bacterium]|nr:hypothetical protein [Deltaproteobacteria bacterium]MBL7204682.1 hypothetical protein [Desulfobacteraceae bacterium]